MGQPRSIRSSPPDPLLNFKFIVSWAPADPTKGGNYEVVAGVNKVGKLSRTTEPMKFGEGGAPEYTHQVPGQTSYAAITLERGVIVSQQFEQWANKVWCYDETKAGEALAVVDYLRNLKIELLNQAGQIARRYYVYNCWPSEYQALPELDAGQGNTVALEVLKIENDGWVRDTSSAVPEPPTIDAPSDAATAGGGSSPASGATGSSAASGATGARG